MDPEAMEILADAEHASWARWMDYLLSKCSHGSQGALIPLGLVERWKRQAATPYAGLSEREKESDRDEVREAASALEAAGYQIVPATAENSKRAADRI
jgi:hypothetical protein